jgi:hypothetical protein
MIGSTAFLSNHAEYGGVIYNEQDDSNWTITLTVFQTNNALIEVSVVDYYYHLTSDVVLVTVKTDSSLNSCGSDEALNGEIVVISDESVSPFHGLAAVCRPEGQIVLIFEAELSVGPVSSSLLLVNFESCSAGEYLEGGMCVSCGPGTYLLSYADELKVPLSPPPLSLVDLIIVSVSHLGCNPEAFDLIFRMLQFHPDDRSPRPILSGLLSDPYLLSL